MQYETAQPRRVAYELRVLATGGFARQAPQRVGGNKPLSKKVFCCNTVKLKVCLHDLHVTILSAEVGSAGRRYAAARADTVLVRLHAKR
eukprot:2516820-Pleurochrysis_carterae.AAC.1